MKSILLTPLVLLALFYSSIVSALTVSLDRPTDLTQVVNTVTFSGNLYGSSGSPSYRLLIGTVSADKTSEGISQACVNSYCSTYFSVSFTWAAGSLPPGDYNANLTVIDNGSFSVSRTLRVIEPPIVEFYNNRLDKFFITSNPSEATAIDSGSAGAGWSRTGNTFKSGGTSPVCRFYGSLNPGPNSHFYTVDLNECNDLKAQQASTPDSQKRWNFESLDFISTPPVNGTCSTGSTPIYRAYNNGFARGVDGNHRITSNLAAIQQVVALGWKNEGVVMCAPQ
jgi:Repeat of unknown function (DUF5648)